MGEVRGVVLPGGEPPETATRRTSVTEDFDRWRDQVALNAAKLQANGALAPELPSLERTPEAKPAQPAKVPNLRDLPFRRTEVAVSRRGAKRDAIFRRALAVADVAGALFALAFAHVVTGIVVDPVVLWLAIFAVVGASKAIGLYDRDELLIGKGTLNEIPSLFQLATLYTLLMTMIASAQGAPFAFESIAVLWGALLVVTLIGRGVARELARGTTAPERCVVLGSEKQAAAIREKLGQFETAHAEIVAYLPFERFELERPRGTDFGRYIAERNVHRVIVAQDASSDRVLQTVRYFKEYGLKVSVLPNILEVVGSSVEFDELGGTTLLGVRSFGLSRSSTLLKRGFDIAGSLGLLVLGTPLFAISALAIKLESRGTVFFKQTRVGRDGRRFVMIKFRTMVAGADRQRADLAGLNETDGLFKLKKDPRVTKVGSFLRHTSLDELPQLINVLRGEMSLVGPRPLVEDEDSRVVGWHRRRLHLTPGMTGAWQIMGETRVPLSEMVMMDYMYIVNWSLWSDVRILLQTASHVVRRRGV
jgi:exopolysaccharide biosynthesis polyprenyl glycosylphosphotransferase